MKCYPGLEQELEQVEKMMVNAMEELLIHRRFGHTGISSFATQTFPDGQTFFQPYVGCLWSQAHH
jgi:hypothetical protein